jgi:starch synthase
MAKMKVLFAAAEAAPFVKSGGLGDVVGSLPSVLNSLGADVRVILPNYGDIPDEYKKEFKFLTSYEVYIGWRKQYCGILTYEKDGVTYYFLDNEYYFERPGLYNYYDDGERFIYFSRAVMNAIPYLDFYPDILHCHDWQTAYMPYLLKHQYHHHYQNMRTVLTVHNIKFQGIYNPEEIKDILNVDYIDNDLIYDGNVNLLKGGMMTANYVTTVSPSYADEIKYDYFGEGLSDILSMIDDKTTGILNGINEEIFNPQTDPNLYYNYTRSIRKKQDNKEKFQEELGLPVNRKVPMLTMVTRLSEQKGLDLIAHVIHEILQRDLQFVVLGNGLKEYENLLIHHAANNSTKVRALIEFNPSLASKVYASGDMLLMPSKFEPCGLAQIIAMRYGSVPIVRETGGLKDTVMPYNKDTGDGNGFTFAHYNAHDMLFCIDRALDVYNNYPDQWEKIVKSAFRSHFSWKNSAQEYLKVYRHISE